MLVWTISRSVWLANSSLAARICSSVGNCGAGLAPQVTTQWAGSAAGVREVKARASRKTVLIFIGEYNRLSYRGGNDRSELRRRTARRVMLHAQSGVLRQTQSSGRQIDARQQDKI